MLILIHCSNNRVLGCAIEGCSIFRSNSTFLISISDPMAVDSGQTCEKNLELDEPMNGSQYPSYENPVEHACSRDLVDDFFLHLVAFQIECSAHH